MKSLLTFKEWFKVGLYSKYISKAKYFPINKCKIKLWMQLYIYISRSLHWNEVLRVVLRKLVVLKMSPLRILVQFINSKTHKSKEQLYCCLFTEKGLWWLLFTGRPLAHWKSNHSSPIYDIRTIIKKKTLIKIPCNRRLKLIYFLAVLEAFWTSLSVIHYYMADKAVKKELPSAVTYLSLGF